MFTCIENTFLKTSLNDDIITFEVVGKCASDLEWESSKSMVDTWYNYLESADMRVGLLFLLQNLIFIKPKHLLEWKDIFVSKKEKTKKYIIGTAIIVENAIIRSFVNTFFHNFDSERPVMIVKNKEDGINFIKSIK